MPSILKREFAPISDQAWAELDAEAARQLRGQLVGRQVVDFSGPHGWELASVNLGRLAVSKSKAGNVGWGVREVLPIIEVRIPFTLKQMDVDNFARGQKDVELKPLQEASRKAAEFEDQAIFNGFKDGSIVGLGDASDHGPVSLGANVEDMPSAVASAVKALRSEGVGGPYHLVLGADPYYELRKTAKHGYPPFRVIQEMIGGEILLSPVVAGGVLVSGRGGDAELTVGKDFSLGYASHDRDSIELFLTETFTFRVIAPEAVVALKAKAARKR